ncbi:MAG: cytochrome c biogenesis protein CcsA [Gammaproteobacteria bacterium]
MVILLHFLAAGGYFAAGRRAAFFWPAAALHAATLAAHYRAEPRFDFGVSLSAFMLLTAAVGWKQTRPPLSQPALLALAGFSVFAPLLFFAPKAPPPPAALAHIVPAMLAYAFAVLAMLQSMDLWRAEWAQRRLAAAAATPLLTLESACFRTLARAFILLSLTLLSGWLAGGENGAPSHKIIFAALTWLAFGGLLCGRYFWGWRGRVARWWLAAGLLFFVLSYFGTHFILQVILNRPA